MIDHRESILQFMRGKGPVLPADVAKHIHSDILMASAHLSELSSNGKLKISNIKIGGSPLYFLSGQESQLQRFADNLHEKEKRAYDQLSQRKVLRDKELEPVIRVALRAIKDYAVALQVNFQGFSEIFWRWYLLTNKEAEELIKPLLRDVLKEDVPEKIKEDNKGDLKKIGPQQFQKEMQKKIESPGQVGQNILKEPEQLEQPVKKVLKKKPKVDHDLFLGKVSSYFSKNNVTILSKEVIRKTEVDFIVHVPSAVGNLEYYCKAKNKKQINDTDLASVFAQGQLRKLPVLLVTGGELTKRAKEMLQKDFKGMSIKHI